MGRQKISSLRFVSGLKCSRPDATISGSMRTQVAASRDSADARSTCRYARHETALSSLTNSRCSFGVSGWLIYEQSW